MEWYFELLIILCYIGLLILILSIFSRLYYSRSLMATLVEWYLRITTKKISEDDVRNSLSQLPKVNDVEYKLPKLLNLKDYVKEEKYQNMQVFTFNKDKIDSSKVIIYLHGGAYVRQPRFHHIKFVKKLAKKSGLPVILPLYPKAPNHTFEESYKLLTSFYLEIRKKYQKVYLMGDSSGGGLALGLCEDFLRKKIAQPDELILFSPWVDISLKNKDIRYYENLDPLLSKKNTIIWGNSWTNNTNTDDYKLSPIYGDMLGLNSVHLFVGTREILYPDIKLCYSIMKDSKVDVKYYVGKGLNHVYPIYPISEANLVMKKLLEIF